MRAVMRLRGPICAGGWVADPVPMILAVHPGTATAHATMAHARQRRFRHRSTPATPEPPAPNECCESGCPLCVHDMYAEELARYRQALAAWEARQQASAP